MDKDIKKRPLYLGKILYEQTDEDHYLTTSQLVDILEKEYGIHAHRTTIGADINVLIEFGMDIQITKSTQNRYNLVNRLFDNTELKTLIDAVVSSKFISKKRSELLSGKLSSLAGANQSGILKRNVSVERRTKTDNEQIFIITDAINEAINRNKKISFSYFSYNTQKEKILRHNGYQYVVSPYKLFWDGDAYYVVGFSEKYQSVSSFRIDRIAKRPEVLVEEPAVPVPCGFDMEEHLNTMFHMFSAERSRVELICDNSVVDSVIDRFGEDIEIMAYDADSFKIDVEIAVTNIFLSWVFGFLGKVRINSPDAVKQKYTDAIRNEARKLEII